MHALLAPGGNPLDPANFLERFLAKRFGCSTSRALSGACDLIHLDEPLLGGAEDHRIVAAPAVRVAVRIVRGGKKRAALAEKLDDDRIGSEDVLALVFGQAFGIDAAVVQRSGSFEAIFLAGEEVLDAVARGGMDDSAALLERDVIGKNAGDFDGQEGMLEFHALEFAAFDRGTNAGFPKAELAPQSIDTIGGNQKGAALRVHDGIVEIGMKSQGAVVRKSPGSGRPNDSFDLAAEVRGTACASANHVKGDPNRRTGVVFVLDFGFGESRAVVDTPIDGLAAAIDVAFFHEVEKGLGGLRLVREVHRQVRLLPAAEDAEALEVAAVLVHVARGKFAALAAKFIGRNFALAAELFFDLGLDGQAMAIPAGHIRGVVACHAPGLDNQVFHDLVQTGAEMDRARRIRRSVVEDEKRAALARREDAVVKPRFLPRGELLGLVLRQARLHGEIGLEQVEGFLQFQRLWHRCAGSRPQSVPLGAPQLTLHSAKHRREVEFRMLQ